jgi:hypothetical protein
MYVQRYVMARLRNHCCLVIVVGADVAVGNVKVS